MNKFSFNHKKPETLTQAYHAGVIIARIENYLPNEKIPPIGVCMANFHALRELLKERLWQKLKSRASFHERIRLYEALTYQPFLPTTIIGSAREFCLGYVAAYDNSRKKFETDKRQIQDAQKIIKHVNLELGISD